MSDLQELQDTLEKLIQSEQKLDEVVAKTLLKNEESHNVRLKCFKRLRVFLKIVIENDALRLRIDGRVINDFVNNAGLKFSELLSKVIVVCNEEVIACKDFKQESNKVEAEANKGYSENENLQVEQNNVVEIIESNNSTNTIEKDLFEEIGVVHKLENTDNVDIYEWHANVNAKYFDAFEVNLSNIPKSIKIIFDFDNSKDLVKLCLPLQKLFGKVSVPKSKALIEMWKYLVNNSLIQRGEEFVLNNILAEVFPFNENDEKTEIGSVLKMDKLTYLMNRYCFLNLDVCAVNLPVENCDRVFDVLFERDDLTDPLKMYKNRNIKLLDSKIDGLKSDLEYIQNQCDCYNKFIDDPIKFFIRLYCDASLSMYDSKVMDSVYKVLKKKEE
ncbi:hypothetical protein EDEG_03017 [Edhazardia aedis USNM 41457]|uniref:DM2 domain-containing protein n=1 Tax=Edhazardia aedis (strain USNM 41457) TaxID=1003232 RepID=J9D4Y5_EDHAE|nr:hypothetical protein EDEG_03017 [Edhazardia aedis USNM 41457]|eukprot:EJW02584.1 hypothetical protein EDEG_03017 [Edhazardia aedis USNM 41457]